MAKRVGPAKIKKLSLEFKLKAFHLSDEPGVLIKGVAESLCIHRFMLSQRRKLVVEAVRAVSDRWPAPAHEFFRRFAARPARVPRESNVEAASAHANGLITT